MRILKRCLAALTLLLLFTTVNAQRFELGLHAGGANYVGDLVTRDISLKEAQPVVGVFGRYYISTHYSVRANLMYGSLVGDDKKYPNVSDRFQRNLSFHSHVFDASIVMEIDIISFFNNDFDIVYRRKGKGAPVNLYLFGGVGLFNFNPKAYYDGKEYELQPLETELAKPDYALTQLNVPLGAGIAWKTKNGWRFGVELGYRITFTDYIDDVSGYYPNMGQLAAENKQIDAALANRTPEVNNQNPPLDKSGLNRGNPEQNDGYAFTTITISHNLNNLFNKGGYKSARHKRYKPGKKYKTGKGYRKFH